MADQQQHAGLAGETSAASEDPRPIVPIAEDFAGIAAAVRQLQAERERLRVDLLLQEALVIRNG